MTWQMLFQFLWEELAHVQKSVFFNNHKGLQSPLSLSTSSYKLLALMKICVYTKQSLYHFSITMQNCKELVREITVINIRLKYTFDPSIFYSYKVPCLCSSCLGNSPNIKVWYTLFNKEVFVLNICTVLNCLGEKC